MSTTRHLKARERILAAATELMREKGVSGTTARAICDRVGVKAPTLYHYFGDMKALQEAVVDHCFASAFGRGASMLEESRDPGDIAVALEQFLAFVRDEPAMFSVLVSRLASGRLPAASVRAVDMLVKLYSDAEVRERLRHSPERSARITVAAAYGAALMTAADPEDAGARNLGTAISEMVLSHLLSGHGGAGDD